MSKRRFPHAFALCMSVVTTFLEPGSAAAVVHIRNEMWSGSGVIPPATGVTRLGLAFDADLVSRGGRAFAIGTATPDGSTWSLLVFEILDAIPPTVWTAHFELAFDLSCETEDGVVRASQIACWMEYVHPQLGTPIRGFLHLGETNPILMTSFELVAWDGAMVAGNATIPIDASACGGSSTLGVYFDPAGTLCHGNIPPGSTGMV